MMCRVKNYLRVMKNFHLAIYGRKKKQNGPKEGRSYFALLNKSYSMKDLKIQY